MVDNPRISRAGSSSSVNDELERRTLSKIYRRLVPVMFVSYLINYVDRSNIGFAAPTMNAELAITATGFGLAAGIFSLGYVLFEVPSNMLMHKLGANVWIARIMATWGIVTICTVFVQGTTSLLVVRFLLGVAEAGFLPGMILYLTYWVPVRHRGRITAVFLLSVPLSAVVGGPASVGLQSLDGAWGLSGWQWIFLGQGVPAVAFAVVVLFRMTPSPEKAAWLTEDERRWLTTELAAESDAHRAHGFRSLRAGLLAPIVLMLGLVYVGISVLPTALAAWLPSIIGSWGAGVYQAALLTAVPWGIAGVAAILWGRYSDRLGPRKVTVVLPLLVCGAALGLSPLSTSRILSLILLSIGIAGFFSALAVFWVVPGRLLTGVAAASGIAVINSMGNIGGFVGPFAIGAIKDVTGSLTGALPFLGIVAATAAVGFALLRLTPQDRQPAASTTPIADQS